MTLSLNKLNRLLSSKGFLAKKYFVIQNMCVYIEVISVVTADILMLYIPSKYKILATDKDEVYKLDYIEVLENGSIATDYAGEPEKEEVEKQYDELDIDNGITADIKDVSGYLEEGYNHPLSLKDVKRNDMNILKEIFRQLRRLKLCVQNIKYKLCIIYKNFLSCIRRDNTFECYSIHAFKGPEQRRLIVTIDLESLYGKLDTVQTDIRTVRDGVYKVLDKNQDKHMHNLAKMLELRNNLALFSENNREKKTKYILYLENMEKLLDGLNTSEREIIDKLNDINEQNDGGVKGIQYDIEKSHLIGKYEAELSNINSTKHELIKNILLIKSKYEDVSLTVDNIVFDNIVMADAIIKNILKLSNI